MVTTNPRQDPISTAFTKITLRILQSTWLIANVLAFGWGPLFVADQIRRLRPDLDASYTLQGFAMDWLPVTLRTTQLAILLVIAHCLASLFLHTRRRIGKGKATEQTKP
jgi:hypothetical protein